MKKSTLIILLALATCTNLFAQISGTCGANLTWTLQDSVLSISGTGAMNDFAWYTETPWFANSSSIMRVVIGDSVTSVGKHAFRNCPNLAFLSISDSVTSIGEYAFFDCKALTSITIPSGVTRIDVDAFGGCPNRTSIAVEQANATYDSRDGCNAIIETTTNTLILGCRNTIIPNSVTSIGDYAFNNCSALTSLNIPNSIIRIGNYAFYNCTRLTSVTIPNGVISIGEQAFYNCYNLTFASISSSVTSIGYGAFGLCDSLKKVEVYNPIPITITELPYPVTYAIFYTFGGPYQRRMPMNNLTIYVPCESLNAYKSAQYWSDYASRIESFPRPNIICNVNDSNRGVVNTFLPPTACDSAILTAVPYDGYYFSKWSDENTDNPRSVQITQDTTFTAEFEKIIIETYVVRFLNDDSTQLQIDTLELGAMPKYRGSTPQKPADQNYKYYFKGWQPEIVAVTSDATYVATYRAIPISALPDVPETRRPKKIFRDNQLYILLPNGTRYDSTGKKVE